MICKKLYLINSATPEKTNSLMKPCQISERKSFDLVTQVWGKQLRMTFIMPKCLAFVYNAMCSQILMPYFNQAAEKSFLALDLY